MSTYETGEELGPERELCRWCSEMVAADEQCRCDVEDAEQREQPAYSYTDTLAPTTVAILVVSGIMVWGLLLAATERLVRLL